MVLHKPEGSIFNFTIDDIFVYDDVMFDSKCGFDYITLTDNEIEQLPDEIPEF